MSNSLDPDETARFEPSHLDLRYLQKPIIIAHGSERTNIYTIYVFSVFFLLKKKIT